MCDYSLHNVTHRPAKVGDKLVSTSFHNSSTRGFIAKDEPGVAICVRPGTELAFANEVRCRSRIWPMRGRILAHRVARFRNVDQDKPYAFHDALEFPGGDVVLLTDIAEGQEATVLQLPVDPQEEKRQRVPADHVQTERV